MQIALCRRQGKLTPSYSSLKRPARMDEVRGADFARCNGGEAAWKRIGKKAQREIGAVLPMSVWPPPDHAPLRPVSQPLAKPAAPAPSQRRRKGPTRTEPPAAHKKERRSKASPDLMEDEVPPMTSQICQLLLTSHLLPLRLLFCLPRLLATARPRLFHPHQG